MGRGRKAVGDESGAMNEPVSPAPDGSSFPSLQPPTNANSLQRYEAVRLLTPCSVLMSKQQPRDSFRRVLIGPRRSFGGTR